MRNCSFLSGCLQILFSHWFWNKFSALQGSWLLKLHIVAIFCSNYYIEHVIFAHNRNFYGNVSSIFLIFTCFYFNNRNIFYLPQGSHSYEFYFMFLQPHHAVFEDSISLSNIIEQLLITCDIVQRNLISSFPFELCSLRVSLVH